MSEGKFRYQNGGTSEYLSPAYLMAHVIPLLNLYDFADDAELRAAAEALLHLHLTHLALNAHQGYILEPHARVHGLQYTSGSNVACAGQFLAWIYFGHMDLPDEVLIGKGRDIIHTALSEFRPLPTLYDLANGGGKAAFPYAARSSAMGWPHAGDRLPRTVLRSVFRNQSYSIGTGYSKHVPDGFYLQHSTFGIAWSSKDPVAYLQCGHPYWRSDRDNPGGWQLAPTSPFMQTAHHENTAIALFHIPEVDPWPDAGRSDWIPYRNDHLKNLVKDAYVILPKSLDQRAAARGSGTEDGRWFFFREGNVYLGVYSLTRTGTPAVDRYRYSIKAQGVRHGDHWQTGFVFEVGTEFDDGTFVEFCEKLQDNPVTVTWGDAGHAAPELEYTDSQSDVLRLRYNPEMRQNEKGTIENQPAVWINGERLDYTRWPDMEGPGVLLKDGVLTVESEKQRTRIDWNGESPVISQAELAGTESQ
jgi:hypothetical protein